jgi:hypothetical protein
VLKDANSPRMASVPSVVSVVVKGDVQLMRAPGRACLDLAPSPLQGEGAKSGMP